MIIFKTIRYKNFLSTGDHFTEFNLTNNSTTLIIGSNGAGKSTVLDALTFTLFGKPFRKINKPQLTNAVNDKNCVAEVEFSIGSTEWKIIRGIKPNIFEIYRNDKLLDQSSSSIDQQKWIEQTVLKMNYKTFTQIVILGSSAFVPFMQLTAANRREVIEDLLDIKIFSTMNAIIKDKLRQSKDEVRTLDLTKESLNDKVKMQKNFIHTLEENGRSKIKESENKVSSLLIEVDDFIKENSTIQTVVESKQNELSVYSGASQKLKKLGNLKGKISQKVLSITEEYKFFNENTVCPTCTQSIEKDFRLNKIEDAQNKINELQSGFNELETAINDEENREHLFNNLSREIIKLTHDISKNNTQISGLQRQSRDLESEIQTITNQLQNKNIEHEKLDLFKQKLESTQKDLKSKKDIIRYYDFSYGLLKDGGVKTQIIKKYLPLINKQVNRYLQMMDFYINFNLDEEFNETVQSPIHEDFTYASFSEGEKMRIDLALLFTWREVAKHKNSVNTNLLIMDEVFDSSLDGFGTDEFLKIIRFVIKDANIFVISHKDGLQDKFDNVIRFEKVKGFSRMI
jgi:DNA repair exonuclease SbcCD ATPase subunit